MIEKTSNKTIARNTMMLYFRMLITLSIILYTSRVILQVLGIDDYGIYQAVGGVVGFLSFINNALATGSSRFLAFGLGEGNAERLKKIFSTTLSAHFILALLIIVFAETAGLWFLYNKMDIPPDRMDAAVWVYHLSVITAFFSLTQVPYNASIIAHERMNIYAYVSIFEAVSKLIIVYALLIGGFDKLIFYAFLICLLQVCIICFYRFYCIRHFEETHFSLGFDKKLFSEIGRFSGWSLFASSAIALNSQGVLILLNMFFAPAVVAARSISLQVNMAATQFVTNFQTASVPQIVKRFAAKEYDESKKLLLQTARFSYYLMLVISLPIFFVANQLLEYWLDVVPDYTTVFLKIIIVQSLFQVFDTTFYYSLYTKGRLKENAIISPGLGFIQFPIVYIMFKLGFSPVALSWASFTLYALLGFVVKPILVVKIVDYTWRDIISVFLPCLKVTISSLVLPSIYICVIKNMYDNQLLDFVITISICILSVTICSWFLGLSPSMREKVVLIIRKKIKKEE